MGNKYKLLKYRHLRRKPYGLNVQFDFGKYKGTKLSVIIAKDPSYINWCLLNVTGFKINKSAKKKLSDTPNPRRTQRTTGTWGYTPDEGDMSREWAMAYEP